jgi:hypothetical protein
MNNKKQTWEVTFPVKYLGESLTHKILLYNLTQDEIFGALSPNKDVLMCMPVMSKYDIKKDKPILITEDGKEIYDENETLWWVLPKATWDLRPIKLSRCILFGEFTMKAWKPFSSRDKAEKYIKENKPMYSRKDMIDFVSDHDNYYNNYDRDIFNFPVNKKYEKEFDTWEAGRLLNSSLSKSRNDNP